jgi:hypothetical protein
VKGDILCVGVFLTFNLLLLMLVRVYNARHINCDGRLLSLAYDGDVSGAQATVKFKRFPRSRKFRSFEMLRARLDNLS